MPTAAFTNAYISNQRSAGFTPWTVDMANPPVLETSSLGSLVAASSYTSTAAYPIMTPTLPALSLWSHLIPKAYALAPDTGDTGGVTTNTDEHDTGMAIEPVTHDSSMLEILEDRVYQDFDACHNFLVEHQYQEYGLGAALLLVPLLNRVITKKGILNKAYQALRDKISGHIPDDIKNLQTTELQKIERDLRYMSIGQKLILGLLALDSVMVVDNLRTYVLENPERVTALTLLGMTVIGLRRYSRNRIDKIEAELTALKKNAPSNTLDHEAQITKAKALYNKIFTLLVAEGVLMAGGFGAILNLLGKLTPITEFIQAHESDALMIGACTYGAFYIDQWIGKIVGRADHAATTPDEKEKAAKLGQVLNVLRIPVWGVSLMSVLSAFGVPVSSVVTSLGLLGTAVTVASRDPIANAASWLLNFHLRKIVKVGDFVVLANMRGVIDAINFQSTTILVANKDGTIVKEHVPNAKLVAEITGDPISDQTLIDTLREGDYVIQTTGDETVRGRVDRIEHQNGLFYLKIFNANSNGTGVPVRRPLYLRDITKDSHTNLGKDVPKLGAVFDPVQGKEIELANGMTIQADDIKGELVHYDDNFIYLRMETGETARILRLALDGKIRLFLKKTSL